MSRIDDAAAAQVADAMQAAYFRRSLFDEREQLCSEIAERRDYIDRRHDRSRSHTAQRLGSHLRSAESQVRYLDRLIARLDHRFGDQLTERD
jgi:predicted Zn-dependent peptidase